MDYNNGNGGNSDLDRAEAEVARIKNLHELGRKADKAQRAHEWRPGKLGDTSTELLELRVAQRTHKLNTISGGEGYGELSAELQDIETEIQRRKELAAIEERVAKLEAAKAPAIDRDTIATIVGLAADCTMAKMARTTKEAEVEEAAQDSVTGINQGVDCNTGLKKGVISTETVKDRLDDIDATYGTTKDAAAAAQSAILGQLKDNAKKLQAFAFKAMKDAEASMPDFPRAVSGPTFHHPVYEFVSLTVDGKDIEKVTAYDVDAGTATSIMGVKDGELVHNHAHGDVAVTFKRRGHDDTYVLTKDGVSNADGLGISMALIPDQPTAQSALNTITDGLMDVCDIMIAGLRKLARKDGDQ